MIATAIACLAFAIFVAGMVWRVVAWARVPVPFPIALTCGQQKSLDGIRAAWLDNPWTRAGAACRMALEALVFRSLFRNSRAVLSEPGTSESGCRPRFIYHADRSLWAGALLFHACLFWLLLGHLRFFLDPAHPGPANLFVDAGLLAGLAFLFLRRVLDPRLRYVSLFSDYLPLALLATVASSGVLMRWWSHADVGLLFYIHLFAACALAASIPFTKLSHVAGMFFSPTHNLPNRSRERPWPNRSPSN